MCIPYTFKENTLSAAAVLLTHAAVKLVVAPDVGTRRPPNLITLAVVLCGTLSVIARADATCIKTSEKPPLTVPTVLARLVPEAVEDC
jgi:hypothetical protein